MKYLRKPLLGYAGLLLLSSGCEQLANDEAIENQALHTRSECIVKLDIESGLIQEARESTISQVFHNDLFGSDKNYDGPTPVLGIGRPRDAFFLQFPERCSERYELARKYIENKLSESLPDDFDLVVREELVLPGPNTIQAYGPQWSDGESPRQEAPGVRVQVDQTGIIEVSPVTDSE